MATIVKQPEKVQWKSLTICFSGRHDW